MDILEKKKLAKELVKKHEGYSLIIKTEEVETESETTFKVSLYTEDDELTKICGNDKESIMNQALDKTINYYKENY